MVKPRRIDEEELDTNALIGHSNWRLPQQGYWSILLYRLSDASCLRETLRQQIRQHGFLGRFLIDKMKLYGPIGTKI